MRPIEEIIADKLIALTQYVVSKMVTPDITVDKISELNVDRIEKLKQQYGIEGIIIDVDDTLRTAMRSIPKCNQDWIDSLNGKIKIIILSNGIDKSIQNYFNKKGIEYIGFAYKPLKKNFLKACKKMNVSPDKVMVIGDSLVADIYGGKKNKMKTALVKRVEDNER